MKTLSAKISLVGLIAAMGVLSSGAQAAQVAPVSYSMPNGDGQASGGAYNYWDKNYTGAGATTTDGAALTGGLGDLTDGVIATDFWYNTETGAGNGPYVGWYSPNTLDPTVTFNFSGSPTITSLRIYLDNSNIGGVFSPQAIFIDGVNSAFTDIADGTIGFIDFTGLSLTGGSHTIQFQQLRPASWTFVSEIQFFGAAVPEPATWALMIGGFGLVGATLRRRRQTA